MSNIRHYRSSEIEVTVGGHKIRPSGGYSGGFTVELEPVVTVDCARSERIDRAWTSTNARDKARFAEPLDEGMSKALREVHASSMSGAEKLAAIQALQRVTTENHCVECGGDGWIVGVEGADPGGGDPGNQCQIVCPSCTQFRDVWDPMLGVFVQKALPQ